jgi:tetratricopeptide (TPR) repeat protein
MQRKLNVKFLLWLLAGLVATSGSLALAHHFQCRRIPMALLKQAQKAEDENDLPRADKYLTRYIEFEPTDVTQKARLALLLTGKKMEANPGIQLRAFFLLQDILARDGERQDLRRLFIPLAIQFRELGVAEEHLKLLPHDETTTGLWARWYEAKDQPEQAIEKYREAVKLASADVEMVNRLVRLLRARHWNTPALDLEAYRKHDADVQEADRVIDEMVRVGADSWQAHVARWNYHRDYYLTKRPGEKRSAFLKEMVLDNLLDYAAKDVARAFKLREGELEVRLAAAEVASMQDNLAQARKHLDRARQLHYQDARLYRAYAGVELQAESNVKVLDENQKLDEKKTRAAKTRFRDAALKWLQQGAQELKPPAQFELQWAYISLLLDTGTPRDLNEAERTIALLRKQQIAPADRDFLQGRLLMGRQQWAEAKQLLDRARPQMQANVAIANQIDMCLGRCYDELNEPRLQEETYKRLLERNPGSIAARLGIAQAKRNQGRIEEAIQIYKELGQVAELPRGAWAEHMRLSIIKAQKNRSVDDWKRVEEMLDETERRQQVDGVEVAILRAESLVAQEKLDRAEEVLEAARQKIPDRIEIPVALATLAQRRRDPDKARRILDEAEKNLKTPAEHVELRLARAGYWVERHNDQTKEELANLAKNLNPFEKEPVQLNRLLQGLAEAQYRSGNYAEAGRLWRELANQEAYRSDLRLRLVLFDLALQEGKEEDMDRVLQEIRRIEGDTGTFGQHATALRLLWLVKKKEISKAEQREKLAEADRLLAQVTSSRPNWSPALMARADLETLRGNPDLALKAFKDAREAGDRSPLVLRKLVEMLEKQDREEAYKYLRRLNPEELAPDLERVTAHLAMLNQDVDYGIDRATRMVREDSRDFRDHVWLGKMLAASGRRAQDAEACFARAIALDRSEADTWVALIRFLVSQDRKADAEAKLTFAQHSIKASQRALAMAQCYTILNKPEQARKHYEEALKEKPRDSAVLAEYAGYYLQHNQWKEAEVLLRRLLDSNIKLTQDESEWAHGRLALILSADEELKRFKEALPHVGLRWNDGELVRDESLVHADSLNMKRLAAHVLASNGQWRTREEAIKRLEELEKRQALTAEDRFLLSRLYELRGDPQKSRAQLNQLALARDCKPQHLVAYAQNLIANRETDDARRTIERLKDLNKANRLPGGDVVLLELQARQLEAEKRGDRAIALLRERLDRGGSPEEILLLISSYGRQKRFTEAFGELDRVWKACPPEMAGATSVALLRSIKPDGKQLEKVEEYLEAARKKDPKSIALLMQLGDVKDLSGNYQEAEDLYRDALRSAPKNVLALNNLAWLLALRARKGEQALELINRAIELGGPRGELIDTRGVIYVILGKATQAQTDFQDALKDAVTPVRYFHLAQAYQLGNDRKAAANALRQAIELGLDVQQLHPVEQVPYRKLREELVQR